MGGGRTQGRSEAWGEGAACVPQCQYKGQGLGNRCGLGGCWEQSWVLSAECWVLSAGDLGSEYLGAECWVLSAGC